MAPAVNSSATTVPSANSPRKQAPATKPGPSQRKKKDDLGAGLRVSKQNLAEHPAGPPRYGELTQAERAFTLASTFLSGVLAISASQFLGAPLKLIDPQFYDGYMAYTKECFAILVTCLTQWWAPTVVRVSGDASMIGQLIQQKDGSLECRFADRMVLMANHQLYTDWLYLWWIAYTNKMHGFVYIILKESLKNVPIIGWGAQFYNFIFLSRKWEDDQRTFQRHLSQLNKPNEPMWLIIFPEGTNLSASTRANSKKWAEKNGLQDMKHQLLPRSTGLRFCLGELKSTTNWLYDCTIAYEGVPAGQFGQDIFTLRSSFFEGRPPKSVNMHWRRFRLEDIPYANTKAFDVWLRNRWREKDYMLEYFGRNNRFPAADFWKDQLELSSSSQGSHQSSGKSIIRSVARPAVQIETEVKSGNWNEFVKIFAPITSIMTALTVAYGGALPADLPIPGGREFLEQHMKTLLGQGGADLKTMPSPAQLEKMVEGAAKLGATQAAAAAAAARRPPPQELTGVQKLTQKNLALLVKETAIKHGVVTPGSPKKSTANVPIAARISPPPLPPPLPSSPVKTTPSTSNHTHSNRLATKPPKRTAPPPPPPPLPPPPKPLPSAPTKAILTASGVTIKAACAPTATPKHQPSSTLTTANGVRIQASQAAREQEAQKNARVGGAGTVMATHKSGGRAPEAKIKRA